MFRRIFSLLSIFLVSLLIISTPSSNARFVGEWESSGAPVEPYVPPGQINYTCMVLVSAYVGDSVIHAREFKSFTRADFLELGRVSMQTAESDNWEYSEDQDDSQIPKLKSYLAGQILTLSFWPSDDGDIAVVDLIPKLMVNGVSVTTYMKNEAPRKLGSVRIDGSLGAEERGYTSLNVTGECTEDQAPKK